MADNPAVRGVRRIELRTDDPVSTAEHYEELLGWDLLFTEDGSVGCWVGDRLAALLRASGDDPPGWYLVFGGAEARQLTGPDGASAAIDSGRPQHGPWAPRPRPGEPCWVELAAPDSEHDEYWIRELGWTAYPQDAEGAERVVLFGADPTGEDAHRPVAGRMLRAQDQDHVADACWVCYFAVPDVAAASKLATELGGTISFGPAEVPAGMVAALVDPYGAEYALLEDPSGWGGNWSI